MSSPGDDALTELLIAQLLQEDLRDAAATKEAEKIQLDLVLADSAMRKGHIPKRSYNTRSNTPPADGDVALELLAADARLTGDAVYAQSLQLSDEASVVANMQFAMRVAAAEKKALLDAEFARRLQSADEEGMDTDDPQMMDAEVVLGRETVEHILAADPNYKGKGKGRVHDHAQPEGPTTRVKAEPTDAKVKFEDQDIDMTHPSCGICLEPYQATHNPLAAARSANSSGKLPFGLRLPCPAKHGYCLECLASYIRTKIDPQGDGTGSSQAIVFPIRCPECPVNQWPGGIQDDVAVRILEGKGMLLWHHQKLLDSIPRYYCPNPRCSALVQVHEDPDEPQAVCPSCTTLICVPCRVVWHDKMTCETYQALPPDERSPEDQLVLSLAKAKNWRRCPSCTVIVELTQGCNHITCRCGGHFCFKCGSPWDQQTKQCTRQPPCKLWDEEMLLAVEERGREERQRGQPPLGGYIPPHLRLAQPAPPPPYHDIARQFIQDAVQQEINRHAFHWLDDPHVVCGRHWFTTNMVRDLTCGYCDNRLNSLADLQYHLTRVRWHPVYACCGRLFKRAEDFERHTRTYSSRFGEHIHQVRREPANQ
ncbi:hypothetical protein JAAARDRAFT_597882 [Jaapia argillacea MUCL 33604]|uniref:RBR-type E3 ubiquitin transferase n=1 Tax=Jaapia argillacea MUCL 33604 TaxID=933084 RepID=A0A067PZM9_9AGAM|nr:hypothetical protein JAAARDRAFT_597882 [Jaapia argillacea MUCL 33604]